MTDTPFLPPTGLPGVEVFLNGPHRSSAADSDVDRLEPSPEWTRDAIAATKFGSPEAIRAALLPEQVGKFDAALTAARQTWQLDQVRHVLRM